MQMFCCRIAQRPGMQCTALAGSCSQREPCCRYTQVRDFDPFVSSSMPQLSHPCRCFACVLRVLFLCLRDWQWSLPARDCWPRRRCVCPFSCWMSLPGSRPVSRICTHRPMPYFIRASLRMATWSLVQPGEGVKFHLHNLGYQTPTGDSAMVELVHRAAGVGRLV